MKAAFQIGQQQKAHPGRIQQSSLLQLNAQGLQAEVQQWLAHNVMLDAEPELVEDDDITLDMDAVWSPADAAAELPWDATVATLARGGSFDGDGPEYQVPAPEATNPLSQVLAALTLEPIPDALQAAVLIVLDAIDELGFLETPLAQLATTHHVAESLLGQALALIQRIGPDGYGARHLDEALELQLRGLQRSSARDLALRIVSRGITRLGRRELDLLRRSLHASPAAFAAALRLLRGLATRPGVTPQEATPVVPDVCVVRRDGRWHVELNSAGQPALRINRATAALLTGLGRDADPLRHQLTEARWLIKSLQQRGQTVLRVSQAVLARQFPVLQHGMEALKPLSLKEIADVVGVHESTVCRAVNGKYVSLPQGVVELRRFFSQAAGEDSVAAAAARAMVKRLIETEDTPLDDGALVEHLNRRGVRLARRTVAKYREALGYPSARLRAAPLAVALSA
ncbi:RNA polymerase factor sigma-54 [Flagellatimonas centrodinii]|uniref:RNA polymerase factor sigma-54 n=1 Tax=Flagellatimonas centrodinii TaxID=2806210 RepID=UPI001FEF2264|nr:RNA polymerase factor sigma-54 [Flagellatimonas centrodinii]ULQ45638.1 RNA polymerase factor sigma-54 [Flagellatimonas centrodinii]